MNKRVLWGATRLLVATTFAALLASGCQQEAKPGKQQVAAAKARVTRATAPTKTAVATPPAKAAVAKIVFVGKKEACDCTRKRVKDSFAALQGALGGQAGIAIERLQIDADKEKVAPYRKLRALMVLPGIYLLDAKGALVEMLQGEVTEAQLKKALGRG